MNASTSFKRDSLSDAAFFAASAAAAAALGSTGGGVLSSFFGGAFNLFSKVLPLSSSIFPVTPSIVDLI